MQCYVCDKLRFSHIYFFVSAEQANLEKVNILGTKKVSNVISFVYK